MASRADQVHSHQFVRQRVNAALAVREPDPPGPGLRRGAPTALAGLLVAVVALAAAAGYGVVRPADDPSWRDGRSLVIESDTGARYVYRDGMLHPVLNYASALLLLGSAEPARVLVPRASLAGVPRGPALGIPGAPEPLPAAADLLRGAWTVCSAGAAAAEESVLAIGGGAGDGLPVGDRALLAVGPDGRDHLIWHGRRYAIQVPGIVLTGLGWRGQAPVPVSAALLGALPSGADLAPIHLDRPGRASALPGHRLGTVVVVTSQSGARQFSVVLADGLAAITQVQADLLLADPANAAGAPVSLTEAEYAAAALAPSLIPAGDTAPPPLTPALAHPGPRGAVCASIVDAQALPRISLVDPLPALVGRSRLTGARVDWVALAPGRGAVVEAMPSASAANGALGLVGDRGTWFPIPSPEVLAMLGYAGVRPQRLPAALVSLLPAGNPLDPGAARAG